MPIFHDIGMQYQNYTMSVNYTEQKMKLYMYIQCKFSQIFPNFILCLNAEK